VGKIIVDPHFLGFGLIAVRLYLLHALVDLSLKYRTAALQVVLVW